MNYIKSHSDDWHGSELFLLSIASKSLARKRTSELKTSYYESFCNVYSRHNSELFFDVCPVMLNKQLNLILIQKNTKSNFKYCYTVINILGRKNNYWNNFALQLWIVLNALFILGWKKLNRLQRSLAAGLQHQHLFNPNLEYTNACKGTSAPTIYLYFLYYTATPLLSAGLRCVSIAASLFITDNVAVQSLNYS